MTLQLSYIWKEATTLIAKHLRNFKGVCDEQLAAISRPKSDKMRVFSLLNSLDLKYETFTMLNSYATYGELVPLLQGFEMRSQLHESPSRHGCLCSHDR